MIEQLFSLIQQESQKEIIENPHIPNEHNNKAVGLATESIFSGLQNVLANGGLQDVMGIFSGKASTDTSNPLVGGIADGFINNLMSKLGLESGIAKTIAATLIPAILGKLVNRTNDPNSNQFDLNGLLGTLIGGRSNGGSPVEVENRSSGIDFGQILNRVNQGGGMDMDNDGDVDLQDIISVVSGAAGNTQRSQQSNSGGGGIMDILGNLMK